MEPVTRFGILPRRPGLSLEEFQLHWRTIHAEAAIGMPGVLRYWQNHRLPPPDGPELPWPGFDACSEIDAESVWDHLGMRFSPAYRGPVSADEPKLLDLARGAAVWTRRTLSEGRVGEGVRLLTFMREHPAGEPDALAAELARGRAPEASGREAFVALRGREAAQIVSAFDAVEALWFEDADAAGAYLRSAAAERDRTALAGIALGTERVLANVNPVV